jgi:hypothetical protein
VAKEASIEVIDGNDESEQEQITTKLAATTTTELTMPPMIATNNDIAPRHVAIADDLIDKMLRPAISIELQKRSLSVKGLKEVSQARLKQAMKDKVHVAIGNNSELLTKKKKKIVTKVNATKVNAIKKKSTTMLVKGFPDRCCWRPLLPSSTAAEPANSTFKLTRAPAVPEDKAANVTVKWDFVENFRGLCF